MKLILFTICLIIPTLVFGQVVSDFNLPVEVCLEEQFQMENTSINSERYEWDFCPNDIEVAPSIELGIQSTAASFNSFKLIESDGKYYGFGVSGSNMYRLDYGNSSENIPTVVNLGDFGLLNSAQGIDIAKDGDQWVGFIGHFLNGGGYIVRLVWDDLETTPTAENIGNMGLASRIPDVKIAENSGEYYVFFAYYNGSNLIRLSLGNSLQNAVEPANTESIGSLTDVQFPIGLDVIEFKGSNYVIFASVLSKVVSAFKFDSDWGSSLSFINSEQFSTLGNLRKIKLYKNEKAYAFLSNGNQIELLDLNGITSTDNFLLKPGLDLPQGSGIDIISDSGKVQLFSSRSGQIDKSTFENICSSAIEYSEETEPVTSFYSSGSFPIQLTAIDSDNNIKSLTKNITVIADEAPLGTINLGANFCIAENISFFLETLDDITSYKWYFGDGNSNTSASPTHQYTSSGTYFISLEVESSAGCPNTFYDTVNILPEPQPAFTTSKAEYCTFENIYFDNITPADYGDNVNWSWDFNGEGVSSAEDPAFAFQTSGTKTITLEANVLGCVDTYQTTLTIIDGPSVAFDYDRDCLGEAIQFNNKSVGDNITGYSWDFGNGQMSTSENPQITYATAGNFTVSLTVSNSSGCENISTQNIQIFAEIVDSIKTTRLIENLPFEIGVDWNDAYDSSQSHDIKWEIDTTAQTTDTASFSLPQGVYNVNVEVTTALGCFFSSMQVIEVQASQKPTSDFNLPVEVCLEEQFQLENTSVNSEKYEWDFCPNDIETVPAIELGIQSTAASFNSFKLIESDGKYYGFGVAGSNIYRLEYGNSSENIPSVVNLGDFGLLNSAQGIDIAKDGDQWVGFIGHFLNGGGYIVRLVWDDLETKPTAENIGNMGVSSRIPDVKIAENSGEYYVFFAYYNGSNLIRLSLGNSLQNAVEPANTESIGSLTDVQFPIGLDVIEFKGSNYVIFASFLSKVVSAFKFDSDWGSNLSFINSEQFSTLGNLKKIKLYKNDKAYAFLSNDNQIELLDLNGIGSVDNFLLKPGLGLPQGSGIDIVSDSGKVQLFSSSSGRIDRSTFENACSSSIEYSEEIDPYINFVSSGTYPITLTAYHPNGNSASITKEITVTNNQAPDISFSTGTNLCVTNPIQFESQSTAALSSLQWNFGDGETSADVNPSHTFAAAGTYAVALSVTDTSGCNNLFVDSVQVFEEPVADFQATAQGSVCSLKPIVFENLANLPTEAVFFWEFGDGITSTLENPEHTYAEAGEYIVRQSIIMAGCEVGKVDTITVNPGPSVSFQTANNCLGEVLQFENTSDGQFLDSFQWVFGDGTQSTLANPSHVYDTAGTYTVQLTALTSNGCDFTIAQEVVVQPLADVAFEAEVACANQPTQFTELVNIAQSNITNYFWDFGVSGTQSDISTAANPEYAYPAAGTYNVSLEVTTSDGCVNSTSQNIFVNAVPEATFDFERKCINENRLFTPVNTENVMSHFWELRNSQGEIVETSASENFSYLFSEAGSYQMTYRQQNENLCSQSSTQSFVINQLPQPDFSWGKACAGELLEFENLTDLKGNTLKNYTWSVDGKLISNDALPQYTFEASGDYLLNLQVETQSGCVQSISKQISISPALNAFFELDQNIGAYPFTLSLNADEYQDSIEPTSNLQLPTSSYLWTLNGDTISNTSELSYTIDSPGTYLLGLITTNEAGCIDEHYEQIRVRKPSLDVALSNLRINENDEFTSFILNISNRGSLVPERIDLTIDLGSYSVTETLETPIYPETNQNMSLSLKLTDDQLRGLSKICIAAAPRSGEYSDLNTQNNRICTNLENAFNVMDIYPNPAQNQFTIPLIIPENGMLTISMEDSNGRQVKVFNYELEAGYSEIKIQRESLSPGIYFLRFRQQGQEKVKKIIFQ